MGRVALVLAGGAARGAYEVGVVQHLLEEVSRDLGREVPIDILCGTSVGALNACFLAAYADEPRARARRMVEVWRSLELDQLVRVDRSGFASALLGFLGRRPRPPHHEKRRGGLLDPTGLERLIETRVPFGRIDEHLRAGRLAALTVSTTHVGSGRTVVFVACKDGLPPWSNDPTVVPRHVSMRAEHALASAALPFLFPAVRIDGQFHCDGGLRQNVPLSPARRLGADGLVVVNPRYIPPLSQELTADNEGAFPGPLFLLGKTLNALLLDRIESDIDRLHRINAILLAGCRRYGPGFLEAINDELGYPPGKSLKPLNAVLVRASADIGRMAAEFVRRPGFRRRVHGLFGRMVQRLAEGESDLLSYLLFDGEFAAELIELGRADAQKKHAELCGLFDGLGTGAPRC